MHVSVFIVLAKFRHLSAITGDEILTGLFYKVEDEGYTVLKSLSTK